MHNYFLLGPPSPLNQENLQGFNTVLESLLFSFCTQPTWPHSAPHDFKCQVCTDNSQTYTSCLDGNLSLRIRCISNCLSSCPFPISLVKRVLVIFPPNIPLKKLSVSDTTFQQLQNQKSLRFILAYLFLLTPHTQSTCYSCQIYHQNISQIWYLLPISTSPALLKSIHLLLLPVSLWQQFYWSPRSFSCLPSEQQWS